MKRSVSILFLLFLGCGVIHAQRLVIGEKAPELKVSRWLSEEPSTRSSVPLILEFFYSPSEPSRARLSILNDLKRSYKDQLEVVVLAKESEETVAPWFKEGLYAVALDDEGKTFESYEVRFVPFCVLFDARGRVVWFGNSSKITEKQVQEFLNLKQD